jgi:hypothetical protein
LAFPVVREDCCDWSEGSKRGQANRQSARVDVTVRNRLILCVGYRGSGKSTVASRILEDRAAFVFDPHCDPAYHWIQNTARTTEQLADYSRWHREAKPKVTALRFIPDGRVDPLESLNDFSAFAWAWHNVWLCIEEVAEGTRSPSAAGMPPELRRIVNQGRHKGINQIYCGLRYAEIPRPISAGADVQILFRCQEPVDLDSMRARIGSEAVERVRGLGQHEALVFFPDRSYQIVGSRDAGIADLVIGDSANVLEDAEKESA